MFIWQLILSDHNVEPLYTTEIIPVGCRILHHMYICKLHAWMHLILWEREREIRPRKYLLHIAIIAGFTSQIMHIKKNQKEQCHPYCHTYRKFIQKLEWAGLCYTYISIEFQHFFFREKLESSQNYLIYGNLIWFQKHFQIGFKFFNLINYLISNILMNAMLH